MLFLGTIGLTITGFIILFFYLIQTDVQKFNQKKIIIQIEVGINFLITLILLIIMGIGMTMYFILFWLILSIVAYYFYSNSVKISFIVATFCTFFLCIFLILQLWIYGTTY